MMIIDVFFFLRTKKEKLRQAYLIANKDRGQCEAAEEWGGTLEDGLSGADHSLRQADRTGKYPPAE